MILKTVKNVSSTFLFISMDLVNSLKLSILYSHFVDFASVDSISYIFSHKKYRLLSASIFLLVFQKFDEYSLADFYCALSFVFSCKQHPSIFHFASLNYLLLHRKKQSVVV